MTNDQKTEIRRIPAVFEEAKSKDRKAKKPWDIQNERGCTEARKGCAVF